MHKPDSCCGSGGSFSQYHYELAKKINDHKAMDIVQTGAEVLVSGCSACRMHISDGLHLQKKLEREGRIVYARRNGTT